MIFLAGKKVERVGNVMGLRRLARGIGLQRLDFISKAMGLSLKTPLKRVPLTYLNGINKKMLNSYTLNKRLRIIKERYLAPHVKYGTYRGLRMRQGLPRNGQSTHSNAGTTRRFARQSYKNLF